MLYFSYMDVKDKKEVGEMIFDKLVEALEQVVLPRLNNLDEEMGDIKADLSNVKEQVSGLTQAVAMLDNDMGGVKMRLSSMEKKMDDRTDTFLVVKDHEKRIKHLEKFAV